MVTTLSYTHPFTFIKEYFVLEHLGQLRSQDEPVERQLLPMVFFCFTLHHVSSFITGTTLRRWIDVLSSSQST